MMEIRSYRRVFDLERRIYTVDRLRLNPGGIPVRGVVYFLAIAAATVIAGRLPLLGALARALPWYARDVALPAAWAALLTAVRVEGRPFHLAAAALARHWSGPRHFVGARPSRPGACSPGRRWLPEEIVMLPDGSDGRMRRLRYTGPGAVLVAVEHERAVSGTGLLGPVARRAGLAVRELPGARAGARGEVIVLERGVRMHVR